jgi:hypothetical protein
VGSVSVREGPKSIVLIIEDHLVSVWIHEKSRISQMYVEIEVLAEANLSGLEKIS